MFENAHRHTHTRRPVSIRFTFPFQMLSFIFISKDVFCWNMFTFRNKSKNEILLLFSYFHSHDSDTAFKKNESGWRRSRSKKETYLYLKYDQRFCIYTYRCTSVYRNVIPFEIPIVNTILQFYSNTPEFHTMTNRENEIFKHVWSLCYSVHMSFFGKRIKNNFQLVCVCVYCRYFECLYNVQIF